MRKFNFSEQALIGKLIANAVDPIGNMPIKALESVFGDYKVTFHSDDVSYFNFYVNEGKEESVKELTKNLYNKLLEAFNLVKYLKKEGLIIELENSREKKKSFGDDVSYVSAGMVEVRVFVEEDLVIEQLVNFMNNAVYVTEALKELQANNFVTYEETVLAEVAALKKKVGKVILFAFLGFAAAVAGIVLSMQNSSASAAPVANPAAEIQATIESKVVPAIAEVKAEIASVKEVVSNLDAEPVNLSELQKTDDEDKTSSKKKSKKKKRK